MTNTDDPLSHPQSEFKTVYAELFEPWDSAIIHRLYENNVTAQLFHLARDSVFIVMIILFTLGEWAPYLSGSITQLRTRAVGFMHDVARNSADFKGRLEQDGAGELSPFGAICSIFVSKLANIIRHVLRTSAEVTRRYEQFSEIIQRTAGRSASQFEKKVIGITNYRADIIIGRL